MNKQESKEKIEKLVEKYQKIADEGKIKFYTEAQTRNEFIEPLFEYLGWDIRNLNNETEVTPKENVSKGRVDLAFRINNIPVMFLEAKSFKVDLDNWKWAEQAINYSWNKGVTWAVLTDFESIKIFNAEIPPKGVNENLFIEIKWNQYIDDFDDLWLLSKESFEEKLLDKRAEKYGKMVRRKPVNEKLFEDLTNWRTILTKEFKKKNRLKDEELDEGMQRVLDRLIFTRTAEDRNVEPNILMTTLREWEANGKIKNLYKQLTKFFRQFDYSYNSELFDIHYCEEWDIDSRAFANIIIELYQTKDGYRYDFSAISTDVLGGIYEQYLSNVLQSAKKKTIVTQEYKKRKSQGIYYTPRYIVEYIVKETLGEVLKKTDPKDIFKIKVLDPACGSGSFLISAYNRIFETIEIRNGQVDSPTKFDILTNNIYGVDLDSQAVEITRLNLLLRVLSERIKMPLLKNNIKNGNSLISGDEDKLKAFFGEDWQDKKPFNWNEEFKEVFEQGGFDVIIGNPPYVRQEAIKDLKPYFEKEFSNVYSGVADLYVYFFERCFQLLKDGGYFGFIVSNKFIRSGYGKNLRKYIQNNFKIISLIDKFDGKVFEDATVDPCIIIIQKSKPRLNHNIKYNYQTKVLQSSLSENGWTFASSSNLEIKKKIESKGKKIKDYKNVKIYFGIKSGFNEAFIINEDKKRELVSKDKKSIEIIKPILRGRDIGRYKIKWQNIYLIVSKIGIDIPRYYAVYEHLKKYKNALEKRTDYKPNLMEWYNLRPCDYYDEFEKPKIIYPDISDTGSFYWDEEGYFFNNTVYMIVGDITKSWTAILNSKLMLWYYKQIASGLGKKGVRYFTQFMKELPIVEDTSSLEKYTEKILDLNKQLLTIPKNTDKWNQIKSDIAKFEKIIDDEVYKLYELTDEEIEIIEQEC